jgi:superkiller protein 3
MDELLAIIKNQPDNIKARMELVKNYLDKQDNANAKILLEEIIAIDSNNIDANYVLGQIYEFEEDYNKAVECFEKIIKFQPDLKYKLAELYENADEYEKALDIYNEYYQKKPDDKDICERVAHVSRILGDNEKAIEIYNKLLKIEPDNIVALTQLAELYENTDKLLCYVTKARVSEQEGTLSQAISAYKKALSEADNPQDTIYIRLAIAEIYVKQENYYKALDEYLSILEIDSNNYKVYKNLAEAYIKLDNPEAAAEAYEKANEIYPDDIEVLKKLANVYLDIENSEKAFELLEKIMKLEPNDLFIRIDLAKSCIAMNNDARAIEELEKVIKKEPRNVEAIGVLVDYHIIKKDYNNALEYIDKIKEYIPKSPFGYKKAGEIYEITGDSFASHYNFGFYHDLKGEKQLAIDEFTWALEKYPENFEILHKLANLYEEIGEEYIAAEYYLKAYKLDKENLQPLKKLSDIYYKKKDWEHLAEVSEALYIKNGKDKDSLLRLAEACEKMKNTADAVKYYKEYLEIAPLSVKTDQVKEQLEKLENKVSGGNEEGFLDKIFGFFSGK